jgi:hypothetical protein
MLEVGTMLRALKTPVAIASLIGLCVAGGCTSRTLPLPPPVITQVAAPDASGNVTVKGIALEGASIGAVNDRTLEGTITTSVTEDCGSACEFEIVVKAAEGDGLRVWQFFETEGAREVLVPRARD